MLHLFKTPSKNNLYDLPSHMPSKNNLYDKIYTEQTKKSRTDRASVSFQRSTNKTMTTKDTSVPKKSKLFLAKNFVKSITPFLKSMKNLQEEKALEKPSNTEIFYYSLRNFISEKISVDELMYAKNFPNRYYQKKRTELRNISNPQKRVISYNNYKMPEDSPVQKVSKAKTFSLVKQNQKSQASKKFKKLWKAIKERIDYRKKIKNELERINPYYLISTSDAKFFANFYSATNDHIDKIRNKDLINSNTKKKFYTNHDLKTLKLNECQLKRPIENISTSKIHEKSTNSDSNNLLCKDFFNKNADLFLSQLENENEENEIAKLRTKIITYSKKPKNGEADNSHKKISLLSVHKNINLDNSQLILSELHNVNSSVISRKKSYIENSFIHSNSKKSSYHENFKEAKERMQYEKKLTDYLHQKPNIHRILKKYTTEISPIITEIHDVENFNDKNMIENISNMNNMSYLKTKFENPKEKTKSTRISKKNDYYFIKRNENSKLLKSTQNTQENSCDSDNQSLTEATLDNLYKESMMIQKRILEKKNDGVGKRLKHFIKLQTISRDINMINAQKLKQ